MLTKTTQEPKAKTKLLHIIRWWLGLLALFHFVWKWGNNEWTTDLLILFTLSDSFVFFIYFVTYLYIQPYLSSKDTFWIYTLSVILLLVMLIGPTLLHKEYHLAFLSIIFWLFPASILVFGLHVAKQRKANSTPASTSFTSKHTD